MKKIEFNDKQLKLLEFIKEQHADQKRKYTGEPYWNHPVEVVDILYDLLSDELFSQPMLIEIALCHDLFEDTKCRYIDLHSFLRKIGYNKEDSEYTCFGVDSLTDVYTREAYPTMNRRQRKIKEAERLGTIEPEFQTVKYADLISNTQSIVEFDPPFAEVYLVEKLFALDHMRGGDIRVLIECCYTFRISLEHSYKNKIR